MEDGKLSGKEKYHPTHPLHPMHPRFRAAEFYKKLMIMADARHIDPEAAEYTTGLMLASMMLHAGPTEQEQTECAMRIVADARQCIAAKWMQGPEQEPEEIPAPVA